jgi:hypothetical protein
MRAEDGRTGGDGPDCSDDVAGCGAVEDVAAGASP